MEHHESVYEGSHVKSKILIAMYPVATFEMLLVIFKNMKCCILCHRPNYRNEDTAVVLGLL